MARISYAEPGNASPELKKIYDGPLKGKPGSVQKAIGHNPETLGAFLPFYVSVGKTLDKKLYELIYIRVSLLNNCKYCTQHHVHSSKQAGLGPVDWAALKEGSSNARFSGQEKAALAYAEKITKAADSATTADIEGLRSAGFSDAQIADLHMLIGLINLTNRFTGPLDLDLEMAEEKI